MQPSTNTTTTRTAMTQNSVMLTDLSDQILLRIFSFVATTKHEPTADVTSSKQDPSHQDHPTSTFDSATTDPLKPDTKKKNAQKKKKNRVAGLGARTLCRLCCCSQRLNHLASADQLWQELTLTRFPDRHWPTTDQKNLDMIRVRREHQLKLLAPSTSSPNHQGSPAQDEEMNDTTDQQQDQVSGDRDEEGQNKKQKRTKFYSRFEQRAHRRKFASLDPELRYTPLAWTNTFWTWKRTFFGNCRFVESKDVSTPNRIDHAVHRNNLDEAREECGRCWRPVRSCICSALTTQLYCNCRVRIMILQHPRCQVSIGTIRILKTTFKYCQIVIGKDFKTGRSIELDQALDDFNCTPLLLYPSHAAVDIKTLVSIDSSDVAPSTRYFCEGCTHPHESTSIEAGSKDQVQSNNNNESPSPYPYKLIIALDGSWSHAKIMYRCNPRLQQLTQIKFPDPPQSIYHELKPEPKVTYTSTAEAVSQAVALLGWPTDPASESLANSAMSEAQLLHEDIIRPLRKMIEIQDTIQDQQKDQEQLDSDAS
ncbi:hypothetical protein EC957_006063 [Mortierella hygrophila]|uniref:tRNA-uridine aminocarboxypropyltransferase n=1 Tax=Mortierella hygrophila TaxID=979708 RepID=A0A9P6F061_9FUNG|nr:hypothetical protein EC957_006063 [Mortierella hygrophila]